MSLDILFDNLGVVLVGALVLWLVIRGRRASRTPEARARAAEIAAAREDAIASIPDGWSVTDPDRERYGTGAEGLAAYGIVASGPGGRRLAALALSKAAAYQTVIKAINGDHPEADAWAPPIPPAAAHARRPAEADDGMLPSGWVLQGVDREDYRSDGAPLLTYGALAVGPGGERALVVARDKDEAVRRLVDRLEGRLEVTESWVFRLDELPTGR